MVEWLIKYKSFSVCEYCLWCQCDQPRLGYQIMGKHPGLSHVEWFWMNSTELVTGRSGFMNFNRGRHTHILCWLFKCTMCRTCCWCRSFLNCIHPLIVVVKILWAKLAHFVWNNPLIILSTKQSVDLVSMFKFKNYQH